VTTVERTASGQSAPPWHALDVEAALAQTGSSLLGLAVSERERRLAQFGPNEVGGRKPKRWPAELAESFTEPLQLLLVAVAVLSAVFGELSDAAAIAGVIVVVAVLETVSEMRAARAIGALKAMTAPTARLAGPDGAREVAVAGLVPGDVIVVEGGDIVPADARVLSARGLRADESTLTGEAQPTGKDAQPVPENTALAERSSMLHAGTAIIAGQGRALVVATGAASQLGQLGGLVEATREPATPLQRALGQLARWVLVAAITASILIPAVGVAMGQPWRDMLLAGLTIAFATVPEELPILITVLLAVAGRQLARQGALLRRLRAGETLGAVTTVVTDKTGTLTENRLRLTEITGDRQQVLTTAVHAQPPEAAGREPMEAELASAARGEGISQHGTHTTVFPFDPTRKLVSCAWEDSGRRWLAVSGAPEAVLQRCALASGDRERIEAQANSTAQRGLRVIAFARRSLSAADPLDPGQPELAERDLEYVGLAAFTDPLRPGATGAVGALTAAGVATIVVTGDHAATAQAVATEAGLPVQFLAGADADALPPAKLRRLLHQGTVIARATPATKHRVVQLLQQRGEIVAVTGDGANDAPALAAADVGIALGRRGADLARAAAGLVLTNDAYPTVVAAIAKGRNITAQLRRAVAFYLGAKAALVTVMLAALASGLPAPFRPVQIVLLEIFMDLGASVAFVAEPAAPQAMHRPPRPPGSPFLDHTVRATIATVAATLTLAVLPAYLITATAGPGTSAAQSAAVLAWLTGHVLIAWSLRTQPWLSWRASPAFPAWSASAIGVGLLAVLTPLGQTVSLPALTPAWAGLAITLAIAAAAVAAALRRALRMPQRL
jgi:P-type Ca2+ transporter type 2C